MAAPIIQPQPGKPLSISSPTDIEAEYEAKQIRELQETYEGLMKDLSPGKRHSNVLVLLLYWDKVAPSYLEVNEEIRQLEEVFSYKYNYTVQRRSLNSIDFPGRSPRALISKYISDAVCEIDERDSLLIVYYAGHGNPGKEGGLILTGGNNHPGSDEDHIALEQAESLVRNAAKADILLIFDCCYAGMVEKDQDRASYHRNYEFLAASTSTTKIPGPYSFTSALIWALERLSTDRNGLLNTEGFSTMKLTETLRKAPGFPNKQVPILLDRDEFCVRKFLLAPLSKGENGMQNLSPPTPDDDHYTNYYGLSLQLLFPALPTTRNIQNLCNGLREMVRLKEMNATQIHWKGLHRKDASSVYMPPMALLAANRFLLPLKRRTKASLNVKETFSFPQRPLTPPPDVAQLQRFALPGSLNEETMGKTLGDAVVDRLDKDNRLVSKDDFYARFYARRWTMGWFFAGCMLATGVCGFLYYCRK